MTFERRMDELGRGFQRMWEAAYALHLTAVEDRPGGRDLALFDTLELACEDLLGWVQEGRQAAERGRLAAQAESPQWPRVRRALGSCREQVQRMDRRFLADLASFERAGQLWELRRSGGKEWPAWVDSVGLAVGECRQQVHRLHELIFECSDELADRLAGVCVSVQQSAVGQMLSEDSDRRHEAEAKT